ncbi:MAG: M23 family metallopeptidase [Rikenellaceae bacterium]
MLRLLTTLALLLQLTTTYAATYNFDEFIFPVENTVRLYSGSFGEMRTDHFHSGVDIKTDGVEGKRVVASNDGYVSRISLSPFGYGLAIYIAHPNGSTTLCGHLSKLREDIHEYMEKERYRTRQHSLNIYPDASKFPVKRGDLVAFSGNSGSSAGPHVHFEVRDGAQRPLNPVKLGIINPTDSIRPTILNIYYTETETIDGVCYTKGVNKYPVTHTSNGEYTLTERDKIWVGREGYLIFEVTDRRNGVTNTFGAYSISASIDDKPFYNFQHDGFSFAQTRYCNAISYYPYQTSTRSEHYRLKRLEGVPRELIKYTDNNGVITTQAGDERVVKITAVDDMENSSTLSFKIKGKDDADCFKAESASADKIIRPSKSSTFIEGDLRVSIPAGAIYEAVIFSSSVSDVDAEEFPSSIKIYSKNHTVMSGDTPLQSAIEVSISADIPQEEQPHVMMILTSRSGRSSMIDAKYSDGKVSASTRTVGSLFVAVDDVAPSITPSFAEGDVLTNASRITFKVSDNYSGLNNYSATLDGEWIALDLSGSQLSHTFKNRADGEIHEVKITITDRCENSTTVTRTFRR